MRFLQMYVLPIYHLPMYCRIQIRDFEKRKKDEKRKVDYFCDNKQLSYLPIKVS